MAKYGVQRSEIARVLERPSHVERDEWVERRFATVAGRRLGVVVTHRLPVLLVATIYVQAQREPPR